MSHYFRCNLSAWKCLFRRLLFLLIWASGLYLGCIVSSESGSSFSPLMRGFFTNTVSIVALISVSVLPFLFSAFAVSIGFSQLLFFICFIKAFSFGFVSGAIYTVFGNVGWLGQLLFMFSDMVSLPLFLLYGVRHISGDRSFSFSEFFFGTAVLILIGSVDFCFVSPVLAML